MLISFLRRFVRREKEIAETKVEALETESMRYRQRAEHLQRDLDETKAALELEFERTKGGVSSSYPYSYMFCFKSYLQFSNLLFYQSSAYLVCPYYALLLNTLFLAI